MTSAPDGHGRDRVVGLAGGAVRRSSSSASSIANDLDDRATVRSEVGEVARLVLRTRVADDVELAVVADRPVDEVGQQPPRSRAVRCSQAR